jgi:hypothetical protein
MSQSTYLPYAKVSQEELLQNLFATYLLCNSLNMFMWIYYTPHFSTYRGADKSLARPTSRCILFDGENICFDTSLVMYINSTNIPPIMIINGIYEHQNLLSL